MSYLKSPCNPCQVLPLLAGPIGYCTFEIEVALLGKYGGGQRLLQVVLTES